MHWSLLLLGSTLAAPVADFSLRDHRGAPRRLADWHDSQLVVALDELLAGKEVSQPETTAPGCFIDRLDRTTRTGRITYTHDIAPILHKHCAGCHRPGEIAPFSLTNYQQTIGWAATIQEVV